MEETFLGAIYAQGVISLRDLCRDDVYCSKTPSCSDPAAYLPWNTCEVVEL